MFYVCYMIIPNICENVQSLELMKTMLLEVNKSFYVSYFLYIVCTED